MNPEKKEHHRVTPMCVDQADFFGEDVEHVVWD